MANASDIIWSTLRTEEMLITTILAQVTGADGAVVQRARAIADYELERAGDHTEMIAVYTAGLQAQVLAAAG